MSGSWVGGVHLHFFFETVLTAVFHDCLGGSFLENGEGSEFGGALLLDCDGTCMVWSSINRRSFDMNWDFNVVFGLFYARYAHIRTPLWLYSTTSN